MRIRTATKADLDELVAMGTACHAEAPSYRGAPFDPAVLREALAAWVDSETHVILVAETPASGHGLSAVIVGAVQQQFFSADLFAVEVVHYARPCCRAPALAEAMVRALEGWAAGWGAVELHLGASSGLNDRALARFYRGLGYRPTAFVLKRTLPQPLKSEG